MVSTIPSDVKCTQLFFYCAASRILAKGTTINPKVYCETLQKLLKIIQNKRCSMLTSSIMLLHNNIIRTYCSLYLRSASIFQLGFVWSPHHISWSCSKWLSFFLIHEKLVESVYSTNFLSSLKHCVASKMTRSWKQEYRLGWIHMQLISLTRELKSCSTMWQMPKFRWQIDWQVI